MIRQLPENNLPLHLAFICTTIVQFLRGVRKFSPLSPVFGGEGLGVRGMITSTAPSPQPSPPKTGERGPGQEGHSDIDAEQDPMKLTGPASRLFDCRV